MTNLFSIRKILLTIFSFLVIQECTCLPTFLCSSSPGDSMPSLPPTFSANIRINYFNELKTVEVRHAIDIDGKRESIELWAPKRHVKYIRQDEQVIFIKYDDEKRPTCAVKSASDIELEDEDAGPNKILAKSTEVFLQTDKINIADPSTQNGIALKKWEGCFKNPFINISIGFTESIWNHPHTSALFENKRYLALIEAQINSDYMVAEYSKFDPTMPDIEEFQPPENVYCEGFQSNKKPPSIPDYFSYDAELIVYVSSEGIAPIVSHRSVYYDYPSRIVRTDFYDPLAKDQDLFSEVTARDISIIHDFTSSVQYNIDPITGKCVTDDFKTTVKVVDIKETSSNEMPKGADFFSLSAQKISYNGKYKTRGYSADVFTARVPSTDGSKIDFIYTWYFSSDRIQIVENDKVERNVLLRMVISPETAFGKENQVDINFYDFDKDEPNAFIYDITSCYNESFSKTFVLTFPANDAIRGSEKFLKLPIHLALQNATGISKQRIFVSEVSFNKKYMFVEFKILEAPSALKPKSKDKSISLDDAVSELKKAISNDLFSVKVLSGKGKLIILKPEPNGFNEFAGDRKEIPSTSSYTEGSVIGLTIGMLILGFILGGITLNLIMSRKYGISLFQKSNNQDNGLNSPFNESSM